jgi:pilus assembly protein CpaB
MSHRFLSVLSVALLVAAAASFVLYRLMAQPAAPPAPTAAVVVAARDLAPGASMGENDLKIENRPGAMPAGAARKLKPLVGRSVRTAVYKNEIVLENRLVPEGGGTGLAAMIPEGMRAAAVRVNDVVGVAGFVLPGMRVDVLMSGNPPGGAPAGSLTRTLLQNIQVLSVGHVFQKDDGKPVSVQVVNLVVTPEQAEILSLASNHATIQLVLRNPLDGKQAATPGAALAALYRGPGTETRAPARPVRPAAVPAAPAAVPPPPPPVLVELIHGVKRTEQRFAPEERP